MHISCRQPRSLAFHEAQKAYRAKSQRSLFFSDILMSHLERQNVKKKLVERSRGRNQGLIEGPTPGARLKDTCSEGRSTTSQFCFRVGCSSEFWLGALCAKLKRNHISDLCLPQKMSKIVTRLFLWAWLILILFQRQLTQTAGWKRKQFTP